MTSARVTYNLSDDLFRQTGQRVVIVDREGMVAFYVDRAELLADPDGVLALMGRHATTLCAGERYPVPIEETG